MVQANPVEDGVPKSNLLNRKQSSVTLDQKRPARLSIDTKGKGADGEKQASDVKDEKFFTGDSPTDYPD